MCTLFLACVNTSSNTNDVILLYDMSDRGKRWAATSCWRGLTGSWESAAALQASTVPPHCWQPSAGAQASLQLCSYRASHSNQGLLLHQHPKKLLRKVGRPDVSVLAPAIDTGGCSQYLNTRWSTNQELCSSSKQGH